MHTIICLKDYSYAYPETDECILKNIDLTIRTGECHCISGPTGSGKTTLALALKGLLPQGIQKGEMLFPSILKGEMPRIGIVLQNPETQILRSTIGSEAAFGLETLCVDPQKMPALVLDALSSLGLEKPLNNKTAMLSMGQKYRLIVASHLVMEPHLLILDEPAGQLDPEGLNRLLDAIMRLKNSGVAFLLCENRPKTLSGVVDFFWHLEEDGSVRPGLSSLLESKEVEPLVVAPQSPHEMGEEIISARDLSLCFDTGSAILSSSSFTIHSGQRVLIDGLNGSGKTSLLRCILGFLQPAQGEVRIFAQKPVPGNLQGRVGCLFQNPQRQIFETSVFEEVAFPLKRMGQKEKDIRYKVMESRTLCSIEDLSDKSPHKLSYGQKHLVALACALVHNPSLLILDDPFAGLDVQKTASIRELLFYINEKQGTTIIWTSHEPGAMRQWAHLSLSLEGGHIAEQ